MTGLYHSWSFRMIISVVSLIEQDRALNPIDILKYWFRAVIFNPVRLESHGETLKNINIGVLLSESLIYLVQNGAWALVFLDPSQVRMCRQCWKILQLKKLGETILRPVLLLASSVTLDPHFVELRVVNGKSLLVWKLDNSSRIIKRKKNLNLPFDWFVTIAFKYIAFWQRNHMSHILGTESLEFPHILLNKLGCPHTMN